MTLFFRYRKSFFGISISLLLLTACVSKKDIIYLQNDSIDQAKVSNAYNTIFKPDDLLQIVISAENIEAVRPFNLPMANFSLVANASGGQAAQLSYLVDSKGEIDFPVLGKIKIGGMSREEAIRYFKERLDPGYVKNPNINIRIANYSISVLGDVGRPGRFTIPNERITILDAIALAGDINISGVRENIKVLREVNHQKLEYQIDIRSKIVLTSPVYYLQQNDIVYVEQNYARVQSASSNTNTSLFISVTGLFITIITLILR